MEEIRKKLNDEHNFHLTLKAIQITDQSLLVDLSNKLKENGKTSLIIDKNNQYESLKYAYDNKIDYILIDEDITYLLPQCIVITKDIVSIIKPIIPVLYMLKDNRIIQHVKTKCHKTMTTFEAFKNKDELFEKILLLIK